MTKQLPYRNPDLPTTERVEDLLARMTIEEKAGLMFQSMLTMGEGGTLAGKHPVFGVPDTHELVTKTLMNHFNIFGPGSAREMALWNNALQDAAKETRLGIPVTISTDPRHGFSENPGASMLAGDFSQWPETLGLAAIGSEDVVEEFGDIARQEYIAVGIRTALHPQIDLATEPRWARINGTFGEDADLTGRLGAAYIRGFQTSAFGARSVATMTKHFPGGGPQMDGEDPHFEYGREQVYPGDNFDHHLKPFEAAFEAGTRQIMPYYGMPMGLDGIEEVGFAFNKEVITGLLREKYKFDGIVCTDWGLVSDAEMMGARFPARAWGAEGLTPLERVEKILNADCDQFGGETCADLVIELVRSGRVDEARIDRSIRRLLREKFELGLFENPYVDPDEATRIVGRADFIAAGLKAQRESLTLLKNGRDGSPCLPLAAGIKVYAEGFSPEVVATYGTVVDSPAEADVALLRLRTPFDPRGEGTFESFFHAGRLNFTPEELEPVLAIAAQVPTVVDLYLERPAIIPELVEASAAVIADYGSSEAAVLDVLFGRDGAAPKGRLPFDMPSSPEAVLSSRSDVPFDTADPLFRFGTGLSY